MTTKDVKLRWPFLDLQLTEHFNLAEFIQTDQSFKLQESNVHRFRLEEIKLTSQFTFISCFLERLRKHAQQSIHVTSGLRTRSLNSAVGGSTSSRHLVGLAVDIMSVNMDILDTALTDLLQVYSHLLHEVHFHDTYIHLSFKAVLEHGDVPKIRDFRSKEFRKSIKYSL